MSYHNWADALPEIIEEVDFSHITDDEWAKIDDAIDTHISMTQEVESHRHEGSFVNVVELQEANRIRQSEQDHSNQLLAEKDREIRDLRWRVQDLRFELQKARDQ